MAALITIPEAMQSLGINSELQGDVTVSLTAAINSAITRMEAEIDSRLSRGTGSDLFLLDPGYFSGIQPDGMFRLQLSAGFIRSDTPVEVLEVDRWLPGAIAEIPSTDWRVAPDTGIVYVAEDHRNKYVRVNYASGLTDSTEMATKYPWLKQALLAYIPMCINALRDSGAGEGSEVNSWRLRGDLAQGILSTYNRRVGFTLRPMIPSWTYAA